VKSVEVEIPEEQNGEVEDVLEKYSSDTFSVEAERKGDETRLYRATVDSSDIDELVEELKSIKEIDSGDLVVRVFRQESLIQKGQKTRGGSSMLSQEEVYSKAQGAPDFNKAQWALTALSGGIASYGLMLDNIAVVIGAMMVAPLLAPLVSSAVSLTVGDSSLLKKSFLTTLISIPAVILISGLSVTPFNLSINPTMNLIVSAGLENMILSVMVGSAATLAFVTGLREQIAGVAVAIAVVPPLSATGIGLTMMNVSFASKAFSIALVNILAVVISGSISLKLLGFTPSTYYKKKKAEKMKYIFPLSVTLMLAVMLLLLYNPF